MMKLGERLDTLAATAAAGEADRRRRYAELVKATAEDSQFDVKAAAAELLALGVSVATFRKDCEAAAEFMAKAAEFAAAKAAEIEAADAEAKASKAVQELLPDYMKARERYEQATTAREREHRRARGLYDRLRQLGQANPHLLFDVPKL